LEILEKRFETSGTDEHATLRISHFVFRIRKHAMQREHHCAAFCDPRFGPLQQTGAEAEAYIGTSEYALRAFHELFHKIMQAELCRWLEIRGAGTLSFRQMLEK